MICATCSNVNIDSTNFQNLSSFIEGGCIFIKTFSTKFSTIKNSEFLNCSSLKGGAISIKDSAVNITSTNFTQNSAKFSNDSEGGAIYINQVSKAYLVNIENCTLKTNSAVKNGGGIQWYGSQPSLTDNTYSGNSADYGANFASFSIDLQLQSKRHLEPLTFVPGVKVDYSFSLYVIDHYSQVVKTDNLSKASLGFINQSSYSISGESESTSKEGTITFVNFTLYGKPGTMPNLTVTPSFYISESENNDESDIHIEASLRKCIIGEVEESELKCTECANNTYNLKAGETCKKCPTGAVCYGGSKIVSASGYWRYSKTSDTFFGCPNPSACLEEVYESDTENCATGYQGKCCQSCSPNYSRTSQNQCSKCLDKDRNSALLSGLMLILVLILIGITYSNIKGAYKEESITSIYFKILMNYVQIVSLTISFDLSWPNFVRKMFEVQGKASGGSEQILSVDCFLESAMKPFYAKLIILALIPIICFVFSALFWFLWKKFVNCENAKEKFVGSIVVQLFYFQPNLVKLNFAIFNCTELAPGYYYMTEEMSIQCWSKEHLTYSLGVAFPSLIVWCIGVPILLVIFLAKNRSNLDKITEKLKYGFLYKGFKQNQFYWEFIIMLKKMLIITASVFLKNVSIPVQALVTFIIIIFGYIAQEKLEPYSFKQLNTMELRAIIVSAVTIYSGLFFLTGDLADEAKIMMFVVMILSNLVFLSYWGYFTFGYYIGKIYIKLNCCKKLFKGKLDQWVTKVVPDAPTEKTLKDSDAEQDPSSSLSKIFSKRSDIYTIKTSISKPN